MVNTPDKPAVSRDASAASAPVGPVAERRLAAILAADIAGYSRLMGIDEQGTLDTLLQLHRRVFAPIVADHRGRIVKLMGDGALVEFASVTHAVTCATALQRAFGEANRERPDDRKLLFRIGINLGDIIIEGSDIYGDGVNLAARLQEAAEPGGIALSASAHEHAAANVEARFHDMGEQSFKNIAKPVRVFTWVDAEPTPARGAGNGTAAIDPPDLPDKPSIAVLPFDNMSGDPEQEYFADGVVESITAALSRIRAFFVIARNSSFAYKGKAMNVRKIGHELGVAYVLEGSVQRAGQRVRITVQLIETRGGAHLWADKYDGAVDDIFDLQDRITEAVAGALQPSIRQAEVERVRRKRPQDMGAYDFTMRAMGHVWMLEEDQASRALELLEQALEIEPDYPLALALAAWCWAQRSVYNWFTDIDLAKANALAHAERAAALSSDDPLILAVLGAVHTFARNYGAARVLLERAVALDPNAAWGLSRLAWLEVYSDRPDEAKMLFHRAMRLSPLDPINFNNFVGLGSAHQVAGEDAEAAAHFRRALEERANAYWVHRNLAPALLASGQEAAARDSVAILMRAHPGMTVARFKNAMVFSPQVLDRIGDGLRALGVPD